MLVRRSAAIAALFLVFMQPATTLAQVNCQQILNALIGGLGGPGYGVDTRAIQLQNIYNTYCLGGQRSQPQPRSVYCGSYQSGQTASENVSGSPVFVPACTSKGESLSVANSMIGDTW